MEFLIPVIGMVLFLGIWGFIEMRKEEKQARQSHAKE